MRSQSTAQENQGRRVLVNVGALGAANLFRIGSSFALQVLVAHFLGVSALGLYAATLAYLHVFQVISEWGLPTLLPRDLAQQPLNRLAGFQAALIVQTSLGLIIWGGVSLAAFLLPGNMTYLLWIGAITLPFYAIMSASMALYEACERMTLVMIVDLSANGLLLIASALVLWRGGQMAHLMVTAAAAQAAAAVLSLALVKRMRLLASPQHRPAWSASWLMRRALPFWGLSLSDVLQQRIDLLLLGLLADPTAIGVYAAANSLARVLIKLAQSYWRALYPTLSRLYLAQREAFMTLYQMALRLGWVAALFAAAVAAGLADNIIALLFGPDFADAASVLRVLIWSAPLYFLEGYLIALLFVHGRPQHSLMVGLAHLGTIILILPVLFMVGGILGAAWCVVMAGVVGVVAGAWYLSSFAATDAIRLGTTLATAACTAWFMGFFQDRPLWALVVGAGFFALSTWFLGGVGREDLVRLRQGFVKG